MNAAAKTLASRVALPKEGADFDRWVAMDDAVGLLRADVSLDHFVLYATVGDIFLRAVLVPSRLLKSPDFGDLMNWSGNPYSSWGRCYSFKPERAWIERPLHGFASRTIAAGEQLVFARNFEGYPDRGHYIELLQKLVHAFDLHYLDSHNAYCRLDRHGDLEEVANIFSIDDPSGGFRGGTVVTINRRLLDEYMTITNATVARMFDITRTKPESLTNWSNSGDDEQKVDDDLCYMRHIQPGHASYMRGVHLVASAMSKKEAARGHGLTDDEPKQYATFIVQDWKNGAVREVSCAPGHSANYFQQASDLPFELSPAFFRPEVLLKYKADSDKYHLQDRSIGCRNSWYLKTFDINEAGQVHTYLCYLRDLPYQEQLYWKSYNEQPKSSISKRALRTDFEGRWHLDYDALQSLRQIVTALNRSQAEWWSPRSERLQDQAHYPVSDSFDEWANEILHLDQLTVEGLKSKWLRNYAKSQGRTPDAKLGSLKLVEECLMGLGFDEDLVREVTAPLHRLHYYRSRVKAHDAGAEVAEIKRAVIKEHGKYRHHYKALCTQCDEALRAIAEGLKDAMRAG